MSEVTELTDEQLEQIGKKIAAGEAGQYEAAILWQQIELLRCLSAQGAGPSEQEITEWFNSKPIWDMRWKLSNPESGLDRSQQKVKLLQAFAEQFFRAPSDPPRLEARKPEPLGFCIGARCPGCAQCDK